MESSLRKCDVTGRFHLAGIDATLATITKCESRECDSATGTAAVSLAPLLDASPVIQVHAFSAMAAFVIGAVQLAAPKGTLPHRSVGWLWVALMVVVAASSFWIHQLRMIGPFSPIHLLSIFVLVMLPLAVMHARRHHVRDHRRAMIGMFTGALVIAGLFTFWPGRIMYEVLFGH
jgi:uncharacterized membrane protein